MLKNTIHMIKEINKGKNLSYNLPIYCAQLTDLYRTSALLEVTMNAVSLFEMKEENLNPYLSDVKDTVNLLQDSINAIFVQGNTEGQRELLDHARTELMRCMQILTTYIDRLQVYEYVMNRVEYRFTHTEEELKEREQKDSREEFLQKVAEYIFQVKDNVVINENIREIIGQLPVRMTKSRFFELLKQSIGVYQGAEQSSVENYLYMVRTAGMLFHTDGEEEYFAEFLPLLEELGSLDYRAITEEVFQVMMDKLGNASSKMHEITELYLVLQELLNSLYAYVIAIEEYDNTVEEPEESITICESILKTLGTYMTSDEEMDSMDEIYEKLGALEGHMESAFEERSHMEAVLEEISMSFLPTVKKLGLSDTVERLELMQKLLASSKFIELTEEECENRLADAAYIGQCSDAVIAEFSTLFSNVNRSVMRGVMAAVLNKMPVFFGSSQEVMDYVSQALEACDNREERYASVDLILQMMEEA